MVEGGEGFLAEFLVEGRLEGAGVNEAGSFFGSGEGAVGVVGAAVVCAGSEEEGCGE